MRSNVKILILILVLSSSYAVAQQPKGFIRNSDGDECWYTQTTRENDTYFFGDDLPGTTSTLIFDDSTCMSADDTGVERQVNIMMINNIITRSYSHNDADFKTRVDELFPTSSLQKRGACIQSATYPAIGVTVDYIESNGSIARVVHGGALYGCSK